MRMQVYKIKDDKTSIELSIKLRHRIWIKKDEEIRDSQEVGGGSTLYTIPSL